jgi:hypothetical protein
MKLKKRKFLLNITYTAECETIEQGKEAVRAYADMQGFSVIGVSLVGSGISDRQKRALHLWFSMLADALNDAGFDMKKTIRKELDIAWTGHTVKEYLWRPCQMAYLQKKSTKQLNKETDINEIYDLVNRVIGERTGVHVPFPSIDGAIDADRENGAY